MDSSSYGTFNYILWERYVWSYYADMYPQWTNKIFDVGHAGQGLAGDWQTDWQKRTIGYIATLTNSGSFNFWILTTDNGGYNSNTVYPLLLNFTNAPPLFYDGSGGLTNQGISPAVKYNYFLPGAIPADTAGGDDGLNSGRQAASLNVNSLLGTPAFDLLHETLTNGWLTDIVGARVLGFYPGAHPKPPGHLAMAQWTLKNQNVETNVAQLIINWNGNTVAMTNHCVVSGTSFSGIIVSGTIHWDRMGMGWDWPHGSYTNDATLAFPAMPVLANQFHWTIQATNLPAGNYTFQMDNRLIFNATDVQLATGVNLWTNKSGWIGDQQQAVLDAIADVYGADHIGLFQTHLAGVAGAHGLRDDVNLRSDEDNASGSGMRGTNLVNAVASDLTSMYSLAAYVQQAAVQTNHSFALTFTSAISINSNSAVTLPTSAFFRQVGNAPSDNSVQNFNPPLFQWTYATNVGGTIGTSVNQFRFQLSTNGFTSAYWDITCSNNFYNFLPPITNADGSIYLGTDSWRIIYMNSNATVNISTGAVHTFTLSVTATNWNRAMLADTNYLLGIATNHPHLWITNGGITALGTFLKTNAWPTPGKTWTSTTNDAFKYQSTNWWNDHSLTNLTGTPLLTVIVAIQDVAFAYYFNASNAVWDINGACGSLDLFCTAFVQQGLDMQDPYDIDPGAEQRIGIAYDWLYPFMTTGQRSNVLYTMKTLTLFCAYDDLWSYQMSPVVTNRFYTNSLTITYNSGMKNGDSHQRFCNPVALTLCMAAMGEDSDLLYLFPMYMNYAFQRLDPYQGDEGRSYSEQSNFKFDREFASFALAATTYPSANLTIDPILTNLAAFFAQWEPTGYKGVFDPWGDLGYGFQSQWFQTRYYDLACLLNNGAIMRQYNRAQTFKPFAGEGYPLQGEAFIPYYFKPPAETDSTSSNYLDLARGWAMASTAPPTDWASFTNGIGFVFQARPAGSRIEHSSFTDGQVDMWAYGAEITAGGAAQNYAKHPMYYNGLLVNGIGLMNPQVPADPIYSQLFNWTNSADFVFVAADITKAFNRSNYNTTGLGNQTYPFYTFASNTVPYVTNVQRAVLFAHRRYLVIFDKLQTTTNATFDWLWHIGEPTAVVNTNACSFTYTCTNAYNSSNVTVYVQHIVNPSEIGLFYGMGTNYSKTNIITGENYLGTDLDFGPYVNSVIWVTNKAPSLNFHFMAIVFPVKWGHPAPTITRLDDNTLTVNDNEGTIDTVTVDPNYAGTITGNFYQINLAGLSGGAIILYNPAPFR